MSDSRAGARTSFSVVIPAHNQARFLGAAIESVLAQDVGADEIIVVDDGSTDDTRAVLSGFGDRVRAIHQANQGAAIARNTAILAAKGSHVALLDADDAWTPAFLPTMRGLIEERPDASVYYGAATLIDSIGRVLPQAMSSRVPPPTDMLATILRGNFLLPSTMVLERAAVVGAGGFRYSEVEDWDLWLRMLLHAAVFVGTDIHVAHYRIHGDSTSANTVAVQHGARLMVEDLFGPDDDHLAEWSADKRRAWGGHYRYCALTSVVRAGDWPACAAPLARALVVDPTLAEDDALFHELALGTQPVGWRGTREHLDLPANARELASVLRRVFDPPTDVRLAALREPVSQAAFMALARVAWQVGERALSREYLGAAAGHGTGALLSPGWWRGYARTLVPDSVLRARRAWARNIGTA